MEWCKKALLGAGLFGLSSLAGCGARHVEFVNSKEGIIKIKSNEVRLSEDGYQVNGKIKGVNIRYTYFRKSLYGINTVWLELKNGKVEMLISDKEDHNRIDGNMNYFRLHNPYLVGRVYCKDNGDIEQRTTGFTEEEAKKIIKWGNVKLWGIYEMCKEKFGDRLKIPYRKEPIQREEEPETYKKPEEEPERSLDDILKDFDF